MTSTRNEWLCGWLAAAAVAEDAGQGVLAEELVGATSVRTAADARKVGLDQQDITRLKRVFAYCCATDKRMRGAE